MAARRSKVTGIRGDVRAHAAALRGWTRHGDGRLVSPPMRCKREEWYLARARPVGGAGLARMAVLVQFLRQGTVVGQRCVWLHAVSGAGPGAELLGWLQTPDVATHLQLSVADKALPAQIAGITFHEVSERDPKCHPLANIPRWSTCRTPFTIRRIVLPTELSGLTSLLDWADVQVVETPESREELWRLARGAACVVAPRWVKELKLTLADLENVASAAWLLVDLDTLARAVAQAGLADAELVTHQAEHGLMSARVEYADVPTRGLALQDVVPYTVLDGAGHFSVRAIKASKSWRRYADDVGFATLLAGETPWAQKHGDVLSAVRAIGGGELIATDLPWLVAGQHGRLLAPRIAEHLLRMHLAAPLKEHTQYWNRWGDMNVIVRDIADLASRYAPLRAVRWAGPDAAVAHLGVALVPPAAPATRQVMIRTGRIDSLAIHDGLPSEPMMIFMKWLAREVREQTAWAQRHLSATSVVWQFDAADGLKYATQFDAAAATPGVATDVVRVRLVGGTETAAPGAGRVIALQQDEGLHGDGSLALLDTLTSRLRRVIERAGVP